MKKGTKYMTEKEFVTIKKLQEMGLKTKMIKDVTGRSYVTINLAKKHRTLAEYRETGRKTAEKHRSQAATTTPQGVEQADITKILQNINSSLVLIDVRLKFIEEHMEISAPRKLKLFR